MSDMFQSIRKKLALVAAVLLVTSISYLPALCSEEGLPAQASSQPSPVKGTDPATSSGQAASSTSNKPGSISAESKLGDGFYLILRSDEDKEKLKPAGENETLIVNDFHLLEPEERQPPLYLVLQSKPFIPIILGADPREDKEESTGKPRLSLQLREDQVGPLEEFTRLHVGGRVAIVIGGDVVSMHKIKTAITGGRIQITRCTEHGCYTLFTRLLKDRPNR